MANWRDWRLIRALFPAKKKGKSDVVRGMDTIQSVVAAFLHEAGFRHLRRAFNRAADDGLVQVIDLQLGTKSLYGRMAVNVGVHIPCVFDAERNDRSSHILYSYDCQIYARVGKLVTGEEDIWWSTTKRVAATCQELPHLLEDYAFPFLTRFSSNAAILREWQAKGRLGFCEIGRSDLIAAILLHSMGDTSAAIAAFDRTIEEAVSHPGFLSHVRTIAHRLGVTLSSEVSPDSTDAL